MTASNTPSALRSEVGVALDKTLLGLLGVIDILTTPRMQTGEFVVGSGTIQSAHGITLTLAEAVETLMRARRLA